MFKAKFCLVLAMALLIVVLCSNVQAHSGDEVVARYQDRFGTTPTIDGIIEWEEWWDANTVTYQAYKDVDIFYTVTVYIKEDGGNLYIAFNIPDTTWRGGTMEEPYIEPDVSWILLDVDHNGGAYPQTDDLALLTYRGGWSSEGHGDPSSRWYVWGSPDDWTAASFNNQEDGFQTEYRIPYLKIGVTAGVAKTVGVAFANRDTCHDIAYYSAWPPSEYSEFDSDVPAKPDVWGDLLFHMRYDLTVQVVDGPTGNPISGASVEVQMCATHTYSLPEGEPEYRFGVTDKDGHVVFHELLAYDYLATASKAGYRPTREEFPEEWTLNENSIFKIGLTPRTLESCDVNGTEKDRFYTNEVVYVKGDGFPCPPDGPFLYDIYVVEDVNWSDGMAIPPRVPGTETDVPTYGYLDVTPVWNAPKPGRYDIVIDRDRDGVYDAGYDFLDDNNIYLTAGFFVVPEYWLGTILGLAGCFAAFGVFRASKV